MSSTPLVLYWRGRPITELTREELIEALEQAARIIDAMRADHEETSSMYRAMMGRA